VHSSVTLMRFSLLAMMALFSRRLLLVRQVT
jgi:hypothetical protein